MGIFPKIGVKIKTYLKPPASMFTYMKGWCVDGFLKTIKNTVDGSEIRRSPVEVGSLSHLIWFYTFKWCMISSIKSISAPLSAMGYKNRASKQVVWSHMQPAMLTRYTGALCYGGWVDFTHEIHWWYIQSREKSKHVFIPPTKYWYSKTATAETVQYVYIIYLKYI